VEEQQQLFKKILLCVDGSENSYKAARKGILIAKQNAAEVFVLFVIDLDLLNELTRVQNKNQAEIKIQMKEYGKAYVHDIEKLCEENQLKCTKLIEEGHPANVILRYTKQYNIDLIVIAHHLKTRTDKMFTSTVCSDIVELAQCMILIVGEKKR